MESLDLKNFRNYCRQAFVFCPGINIFYGKNGQGKTNILEAVYYLSVSRSFRTSQDSEIVRLGSDYFYLQGTFAIGEGRHFAEIGYMQPRSLQIKINGKPFSRSEYLYRHPVVVFAPDDLLMVKEGPSVRRHFLDMECSRLKPLYYGRLRDYYRALRQRNRLLKENRGNRYFDISLLEPWEQVLAQSGSWIIRERIRFLESLESLAQPYFASLTAESEKLSLCYKSALDPVDGSEWDEGFMKEQLVKSRSLELRKGSTSLGPHLDDFILLINGLDIRKYGSQGQQRSTVLALKMGEVDLFDRAGGERSILLLDDVFSELDGDRRRRLLNFLNSRDDQSFITTAVPLQDLKKDYSQGSCFFMICEGKVNLERAGQGY